MVYAADSKSTRAVITPDSSLVSISVKYLIIVGN